MLIHLLFYIIQVWKFSRFCKNLCFCALLAVSEIDAKLLKNPDLKIYAINICVHVNIVMILLIAWSWAFYPTCTFMPDNKKLCQLLLILSLFLYSFTFNKSYLLQFYLTLCRYILTVCVFQMLQTSQYLPSPAQLI